MSNKEKETTTDNHASAVTHPPHYKNHASGVECIEIAEHMSFCLGNAIKYIWRADWQADERGQAIEDLRKANWYIEREIELRIKSVNLLKNQNEHPQ